MPDTDHTRPSRDTTAAASLMISCEHGGNSVPPEFRALFEQLQAVLESHRGYDAGALQMAEIFALALHAPLLFSTTSRLLVDLNRSVGHPKLHAEAIRRLPTTQRMEIIEHHYRPYRTEAERLASEALNRSGTAIHLSCHSFTPVLDGRVRAADIGLLYDPASPTETEFCLRWQTALKQHCPDLRVYRNSPYRGSNDGLTTWLRKQFPGGGYLGIELEINQRLISGNATGWAVLQQALLASLRDVLATLPARRQGPPQTARPAGRSIT
jgi:predicted N-formylglutamate amidohydrolase